MGERIKCDKCGKESSREEWKGKIHVVIDGFDVTYQIDICEDCEYILMKNFSKEVSLFFEKPLVKSWRVLSDL